MRQQRIATSALISFVVGATLSPGTQSNSPLPQTISKESVLETIHSSFSSDLSSNQDLQPEASAIDGENNHNQKPPNTIIDLLVWLKSFVTEGTFDATNFEFQQEEIQAELNRVGNVVATLVPDEEVASQITFARHMFHTMTEAIAPLKHYDMCELPGHVWVYKIIELSVRLFMVHDYHGDLDLSIAWYEVVVFNFWRDVQVWRRVFKHLENVPEDMREVYKTHSDQAENTLRKLASQFPNLESYD